MSASDGSQSKHAVVIGGGLAGLSAGYDLARLGYRVSLLEAGPDFGGLASSFNFGGRMVERYYHFICRNDFDLFEMIAELGLSEQLHWRQTRTAFYSNRRMYDFGTPFDLLGFDSIPLAQRIRFGFHILWSRYLKEWEELDRIPAKAWLIRNIGQQAYDAIWHPLLKVKFGAFYDQISAAWIWHRIWRVAKSRQGLLAPEMFGYLENGSASLYEPLASRLCEMPGSSVQTGARVERIAVEDGKVTGVITGAGCIPCDRVVSTVPTSILCGLLPGRDDPYFSKVRAIQSIGVVCMLLSLSQPFSPYYWMNINDERISYNGIIEYTNLNTHLRDRGTYLLYIPYYLSADEPRFSFSNRDLFDEYVQSLQLINPHFDSMQIMGWKVWRDPYAQAICKTNFRELVPGIRTPIRGLYMTDSSQFYPEDRTLSAAIRLGRKAAHLVREDEA